MNTDNTHDMARSPREKAIISWVLCIYVFVPVILLVIFLFAEAYTKYKIIVNHVTVSGVITGGQTYNGTRYFPPRSVVRYKYNFHSVIFNITQTYEGTFVSNEAYYKPSLIGKTLPIVFDPRHPDRSLPAWRGQILKHDDFDSVITLSIIIVSAAIVLWWLLYQETTSDPDRRQWWRIK